MDDVLNALVELFELSPEKAKELMTQHKSVIKTCEVFKQSAKFTATQVVKAECTRLKVRELPNDARQ